MYFYECFATSFIRGVLALHSAPTPHLQSSLHGKVEVNASTQQKKRNMN